MTKENCLIVHAAGKQLDLLRGEASRIAKGSKVDWSIDRADVGTRFCLKMRRQKRPSRVPATASAFPAETAKPEPAGKLLNYLRSPSGCGWIMLWDHRSRWRSDSLWRRFSETSLLCAAFGR